MAERWTIDELTRLVTAALETADYEGQVSGRVRQTPDKRTIRYYTTLGLLDRPSELRGRTAYYSRRHVLQLAAIKRLQAKGMSLVQIQAVLTGADDRRLARWAGISARFWDEHRPAPSTPPDPDALLASPTPPDQAPPDVPPTAEAADSPPPRAGPFWRTTPAVANDPVARLDRDERDATAGVTASPAMMLQLADDVFLVVQNASRKRLDSHEAAELAPASEMLLATLRRLKVIA